MSRANDIDPSIITYNLLELTLLSKDLNIIVLTLSTTNNTDDVDR